MDYLRVTRIILFFGFISAIFLYLAVKTIWRNDSAHSKYLFSFYLTQTLVFVINLVYLFIFVEHIVHFMYLVLVFVGSLGLGLIFLFNWMLISPTESRSLHRTRIFYILIYASLLCCMFFFPENVTINENTQWAPVWSFYFTVYIIAINFFMAVCPLIVISIRSVKRIKDKSLKRKFLCYCLSLYLYFVVLCLTAVLNYLNMDSLNLLYFLIGMILLPSGYLMYRGMNKI